jgi:hypothetical protein
MMLSVRDSYRYKFYQGSSHLALASIDFLSDVPPATPVSISAIVVRMVSVDTSASLIIRAHALDLRHVFDKCGVSANMQVYTCMSP